MYWADKRFQVAKFHGDHYLHWQFWIGWPALAAGLLFALAGVLRGRAWPLVVSGVLLMPMGLYLSLTPRFAWGFLLPLSSFGAAVMVRRGLRGAAWGLVTLLIAAVGYLALVLFVP